MINKLRALNAWYSKGLDGGAQLRVAINSADSIDQLRDLIGAFFFGPGSARERLIARAPVGQFAG